VSKGKLSLVCIACEHGSGFKHPGANVRRDRLFSLQEDVLGPIESLSQEVKKRGRPNKKHKDVGPSTMFTLVVAGVGMVMKSDSMTKIECSDDENSFSKYYT
jgi:hypothetical protein